MTGMGVSRAGSDYLRSALDLLYDVEEKVKVASILFPRALLHTCYWAPWCVVFRTVDSKIGMSLKAAFRLGGIGQNCARRHGGFFVDCVVRSSFDSDVLDEFFFYFPTCIQRAFPDPSS